MGNHAFWRKKQSIFIFDGEKKIFFKKTEKMTCIFLNKKFEKNACRKNIFNGFSQKIFIEWQSAYARSFVLIVEKISWYISFLYLLSNLNKNLSKMAKNEEKNSKIAEKFKYLTNYGSIQYQTLGRKFPSPEEPKKRNRKWIRPSGANIIFYIREVVGQNFSSQGIFFMIDLILKSNEQQLFTFTQHRNSLGKVPNRHILLFLGTISHLCLIV